jgi:hypothetical protein
MNGAALEIIGTKVEMSGGNIEINETILQTNYGRLDIHGANSENMEPT